MNGGRMMLLSDLVSPHEVAIMLRVQTATVYQWRNRGLLPEPLRTFGKVPVWDALDITEWADNTGRIPRG